MVGRPKTFDENKAIDAFVEVFWANGYNETSIDALQTAVGINRGSFYSSFGNKEAAFAAALQRYADSITKPVVASVDDAEDPKQGLCGLIRQVGAFMATHTGRGCLFLSSVVEKPQLAPEHGAQLDQIAQFLSCKIMEKAQETIDSHSVKSLEDGETIRDYVLSVLHGLNAMARVGSDPGAILSAADTAASFLETA